MRSRKNGAVSSLRLFYGTVVIRLKEQCEMTKESRLASSNRGLSPVSPKCENTLVVAAQACFSTAHDSAGFYQVLCYRALIVFENNFLVLISGLPSSSFYKFKQNLCYHYLNIILIQSILLRIHEMKKSVLGHRTSFYEHRVFSKISDIKKTSTS